MDNMDPRFYTHSPSTRTRRRGRWGFSLVEMMTAMTIGSMVVAVVYSLGGATARNFETQGRLSNTQTAVRMAFDRVRQDFQRASSGMGADPSLEQTCVAPAQNYAAIAVTQSNSTSAAEVPQATLNDVQADRVRLIGNYDTGESFLVTFSADGSQAFLDADWQGFRRAFPDATTAADRFATTTLLRFETTQGRVHYARSTAVSADYTTTPSTPRVTLTFTPSIPTTTGCISGLGEGTLMTPLSIVRYEISGSTTNRSLLQAASRNVTAQGPYSALVRYELSPVDFSTVANTTETILDWAVHFDVDLFVDTAAAVAPGNRRVPTITLRDDAAAQSTSDSPPARVRAARISLAGRTPEVDPRVRWPSAWDPRPSSAPLTIFRPIATGTGTRPGGARVRMVTASVVLPNFVYRGQ